MVYDQTKDPYRYENIPLDGLALGRGAVLITPSASELISNGRYPKYLWLPVGGSVTLTALDPNFGSITETFPAGYIPWRASKVTAASVSVYAVY